MDKLLDIESTAHLVVTSPEEPLLPSFERVELKVIRRDGTITQFDPQRITVAMKKAFLAVKGNDAAQSDYIQKTTANLTKKITARLKRRWPAGGSEHIETIQDLVELVLMQANEQQVARSYVLYREARHQERLKNQQMLAECNQQKEASLHIVLEDGQRQPLTSEWLTQLVTPACDGLEEVSADTIVKEAMNNLFEGASMKDVYKSLIISARAFIETEPNYTYTTARLLLHDLYNEALTALNIEHQLSEQTIEKLYPVCFKRFIKKGIELELLAPSLKDFDLELLSQAINTKRDHTFTYLGLQTLYDRYFIHHHNARIELPQVFFMRVAMGLAHCEGQSRNERAIEFYDLLSSFDYMSSTPTLFNSGTLRPQLSSCYLTTVPDDLHGIFSAIRDNAMLSKFAGGLGNDWTPVRAMGSHIKGTNGQSLGVSPYLRIVNDTAVAVNQGGKRKGAVCAYLESWHLDIEEFLELRKNTGDERRRTPDMNTANWVPDLLLQRVFEDKPWSLFSPNEVPDLHELYGDAFEKAYCAYEEKAERGEIRRRQIPAKTLWRKMLTMLYETGHPWITFKDACNLRSPQQHAGVIHSSNLCTEITLNTSQEEIAVCNLGSINLVKHLENGQLNIQKIKKTVKTAIRMLDNVIDINYYSVPQARQSNLRHRPIGLGIMGFQDTLYEQKRPYASEEAVEFADNCMEVISYYAILASVELAEERGTYESYNGSLWSQGILPIDSIKLLKASRGEFLHQNTKQTLDWASLRERVRKVGMRNSNVTAIAPTATIANICGVTQSTEPTYQNLFVKSNLSGEFTVTNPYLVRDLKQRKLWDKAMAHDLKYYNGSLQPIQRVPQELKQLYATAFEINPRWLVEAASRRQKWIDQSHSLNLYLSNPSGKKLDTLYRMAWLLGLKSTYYLRTLAATSTEKATIADHQLNAVLVAHPPIPSADEPQCEACE